MNIGQNVFDLERFIMKYIFLLVVIFSLGCNSKLESSVKDEKYELVCKHPAGHIVRYPVSFNTFWRPHNMKGGIFRFETTDGRIIRSSFCHGEAVH